MKYIILVTSVVVFSMSVFGQQCPAMPPGLLCISQAAGNVAAQNARTVKAQEEKIAVQALALTEKDKSIEQIRETARVNDIEKTKSLHATEVKLAETTGENVTLKAMLNLTMTLLDTAIKNTRKKSIGILAM